jgi:hypothetical protein
MLDELHIFWTPGRLKQSLNNLALWEDAGIEPQYPAKRIVFQVRCLGGGEYSMTPDAVIDAINWAEEWKREHGAKHQIELAWYPMLQDYFCRDDVSAWWDEDTWEHMMADMQRLLRVVPRSGPEANMIGFDLELYADKPQRYPYSHQQPITQKAMRWWWFHLSLWKLTRPVVAPGVTYLPNRTMRRDLPNQLDLVNLTEYTYTTPELAPRFDEAAGWLGQGNLNGFRGQLARYPDWLRTQHGIRRGWLWFYTPDPLDAYGGFLGPDWIMSRERFVEEVLGPHGMTYDKPGDYRRASSAAIFDAQLADGAADFDRQTWHVKEGPKELAEEIEHKKQKEA